MCGHGLPSRSRQTDKVYESRLPIKMNKIRTNGAHAHWRRAGNQQFLLEAPRAWIKPGRMSKGASLPQRGGKPPPLKPRRQRIRVDQWEIHYWTKKVHGQNLTQSR